MAVNQSLEDWQANDKVRRLWASDASLWTGTDESSGRVLVAAALAQEYGFTDIDGKQPRPLTLQDV